MPGFQIPTGFGNMRFPLPEAPVSPYLDATSYQALSSLAGGALAANVTLFNMLLSTLAPPEYAPSTPPYKESYDFIVVGSGAAGSTLASRLSELPCVDVLVLEAGSDPPSLTQVPALGVLFLGTGIDWNYNTTSQRHTGRALENREVRFVSGKAVGGTTILNAMLFVRGNRKNYDEWAAQGATGWSYEEVLPYFKKMERNLNPDSVDKAYHGFFGPLSVMHPPYVAELQVAVKNAAESLGYTVGDSNGRQQRGFYDIQATMDNGERCSAARAYLNPAKHRRNLHVLKNAFVTRVLIERDRAVGVQFDISGETFCVFARREVILSAGAVNSPKILKLSGIGPREELERLQIPVIADLPVGLNLQDHPVAFLGYEMSQLIPQFEMKISDPVNLAQYALRRVGPLASAYTISSMAFLAKDKNAPDDKLPDFEMYFAEGSNLAVQKASNIKPEVFEKIFAPHDPETKMFCLSMLLNPRSRGSVMLRSADPYDPPLIDPNYFENIEDIKDVVAGLKMCNVVANTEAMKEIGVKRWDTKYPGCEEFELDSDEYLECLVRTFVLSLWHPSGTAKMGRVGDPSTVVDPQLRVKGIKGLRVVDASIMPKVTSGNTYIPTVMIGEKAADMIKSTVADCSTRWKGIKSFRFRG